MRLVRKIVIVLLGLFFIGFLLFEFPEVGTGLNDLKDFFLSNENIQNQINHGRNELDRYIESGEYPKLVKNVIGTAKDVAVTVIDTGKEMFADDLEKYSNDYGNTAISFEYEGKTIEIPTFSGEGVVDLGSSTINPADYETMEAFEYYGDLDSLGRVTYAIANINDDLGPATGEERGDISSIKPTGWVQAKYTGIVEGGYLYNRCHMIGWQLTAENANKNNLMTGTRYMNMNMLVYENKISAYVAFAEENNVVYRVTPVFIGDNLLAHGVILEARSLKSDDVNFLVYLYNVQPNIEIDYATGESKISVDLT